MPHGSTSAAMAMAMAPSFFGTVVRSTAPAPAPTPAPAWAAPSRGRRRPRRAVAAARRGEGGGGERAGGRGGAGQALYRALVEQLRAGGRRPIEAADALKKVQGERPELLQLAAGALVAYLVYDIAAGAR